MCENKIKFIIEHEKDEQGFHLHPMKFSVGTNDSPSFKLNFGLYFCVDGAIIHKYLSWEDLYEHGPYTFDDLFQQCIALREYSPDCEVNIFACRGKCNSFFESEDFFNSTVKYVSQPVYKGKGGGSGGNTITDLETIQNLQRNAFEYSDVIPVTQEQLLYYLSADEELEPEQIVQQLKLKQDIKVRYNEEVITGGKRRNKRRSRRARKNKTRRKSHRKQT